LTPIVAAGACSRRLRDKESRQTIFSSILFFPLALFLAALAILVPHANAQGCIHEASNPTAELRQPEAARAFPADSGTNEGNGETGRQPAAMAESTVAEASTDQAADAPPETTRAKKIPRAKAPDFNRDIYYKNKLEFSLDVGWLPINVPFPFDVFEGDAYELYPLRYTLVPILASLRWHLDDVGGPVILRGNYDVTFTGAVTAIPRGAETHYFSYDMGIRRNFVPRNWRVSPYFDMRAGLGLIDAKGPLGVYFAQGENFTFNLNMGSGVRYNFNPRYGITAGLNWMHISNANLSSPLYSNYGINVYGPVFGLDIRLRKRAGHDGP
jgi:Lipid A 3-O-deacylase (PagL)